MKKKLPTFTVLFCLLLLTNTLQAEDKKASPDRFRIAIGGYKVTNFDSSLSLTEPVIGAGISIDPDATLGLDSKQTVTRIDGYYRFTPKHALSYSWYRISSNGNKNLEEQFDWLDENGDPIIIEAGARVDTVLDYDIFKLGYLWSFYHNEKVELSAGAGLHITRIKLGLQATSSFDQDLHAKDVSTTVPLPVISLGIKYTVTPKFAWYIKTEAFALSFDDWEGVYTDSTAGIEYRAWKNIGLGVGLGSNALKITETTDKYKFSYDNRITGINIYAAAYF